MTIVIEFENEHKQDEGGLIRCDQPQKRIQEKRRTTMTARTHPSAALIQQLDITDLAASSHLFADNFVWHFFNQKLAEVNGDYFGVEGLKTFFERLKLHTDGTFQVEPVSLIPIGDELLVTHVVDRMTVDGSLIELDAVVIWRIVDGLIAEAWDIPSLYVERIKSFSRSQHMGMTA